MYHLILIGVNLLLLLIVYRTMLREPLQKNVNIDQLNAVLPQTQCGRCGYAGCKNYATALVSGNVKSNLCPPGGQATKHSIEKMLPESMTFSAIVDAHDTIANETKISMYNLASEAFIPRVAVIDTSQCIGCVLCVTQCPTGAILGTRGSSHQVIDHLCTGCDLCVPICPTACIDMLVDEKNARDTDNWSSKQQRSVDLTAYSELWNISLEHRQSSAPTPLEGDKEQPKPQAENSDEQILNPIQLKLAKVALEKLGRASGNTEQIDALKKQIALAEESMRHPQ